MTFVLVLLMWKGELQIKAFPVESMERCMEALPQVAQHVPDTASVTCVHLRVSEKES